MQTPNQCDPDKVTSQTRKQFQGIWIPAALSKNESITSEEKLLLSQIKALDREKGCVASNEYLSKCVGLSKFTVSRLVGQASRRGIVEVSYDGMKRSIRMIQDIEGELILSSVQPRKRERLAAPTPLAESTTDPCGVRNAALRNPQHR